MTISSYDEEGTMTTPFDMLIRNRVSRYHLAEMAVRAGAERNPHMYVDLEKLLTRIQGDLVDVSRYIKDTSEGMLPYNLINPVLVTY